MVNTKDKRYYQKHKAERQQSANQYYQSHKAEALQHKKQYYRTIRGYIRTIWNNICQRCNNPKNPHYKYYGERGIKVKFASFENFYDYIVKELKVEPRGLTIDRIDNDGHYERGNIRFVSQAENLRNTRA